MRTEEYIARAKERLQNLSMPEPNTACQIWIGDSVKGYGRSSFAGKKYMAHRLSYTLNVGEIPIGLTLDHTCKNTYCINPSHLEPVTMKENTMRGTSFSSINAKKTHCPIGHPFDDENTFYYKNNGRRGCRKCMNAQSLNRYHSKRKTICQ